MAFPTTAVLEPGGLPNENPISTNWDGPVELGDIPIQRTSDALARGAAPGGSSWYDLSTFGPNCEVYGTVTVLEAATNATEALLLRMQDVGTAVNDGYGLEYSARTTPSTDRIRIFRTDNGTSTVLDTYVVGTLTAPFQVGLSAEGSSLQAWYNNGSGWVSVLTVSDATYAGAGYIGAGFIRSTTRLTLFGGGTITSPDVGTRLIRSAQRW